jgi:Contractile injection system tube protein
MPGGLRNQPKVFRGAFVEYGLTIPPLMVVFQFNPLQLSRSRKQDFSMTAYAEGEEEGRGLTLRDFHQGFKDLLQLRDAQYVTTHPESLGFEIRLDATDKLNEGDRLSEQFGIAPQLATLELMAQPKNESVFGALVEQLLPRGFSFTCTDKPPMILFIWGRKRVLPVNINSMTITETEFHTSLEPIRATVEVDLTVIEGPNPAYMYTKSLKEVMSGLGLANLRSADVTDVVIPR